MNDDQFRKIMVSDSAAECDRSYLTLQNQQQLANNGLE